MGSIKPKWYWGPLFPFIPFFITMDLLTPKATALPNNAPDKNTLDDINRPTTEEGRTISLFFGTTLSAPNCVWSGDLKSKETESHDIPTGFAYFLGMMWAIGGPIDNILRFYRDDNLVYKGKVFSTGDGEPEWGEPSIDTANFRATFRAQMGKAREKGQGGSRTGKSRVRLYRGNQPQESDNSAAVDSYLSSADAVGDDTVYPGISYLAMNRVFIGDDASAVPGYTFVAKRTAGMVHQDLRAEWPDYEVSFTSSGDDADMADANPAYVILYLLTNTLNPDDPFCGFLGIPEAQVDLDTFKAVGETLKDEGTGISFSMDDAKTAQDWIDEICRHIDAKVFFDDTIGKFTIKLIRDDYDVETIPSLTSDDYSGMVITRKTPYDLFTDLEIKYTSRRTMKEVGLGLIINGALRDMLGVIKSKRLVFPMITHPATAEACAARNQRRFFYPLSTGTFQLSRETAILKPGDPFLLPSVNCGGVTLTNIVGRVMGIGKVDDSDCLYQVDWVEDIFNQGGVALQGTDDGDYTETDWRITNPPRFTVIKDAPQELATYRKVMVLTARPDSQIATDWQLQKGELVQDEATGEITGDVNVLGTGQVNATGLLVGAYSGPSGDLGAWVDHSTTGFVIDNAIGLDYTDSTDLVEFEDSDEEWGKLTHRFLVDVSGTSSGGLNSEDFEIIGVKKLEDLGGTGASRQWRATGILRGLYGTAPIPLEDGGEFAAWPDNTRIWLLGTSVIGGLGLVDIAPLESIDGVATTDVFITQFNQYENGDPLAANFTYGFRPETPYNLAALTATRPGPPGEVTLLLYPRARQSNIPLADDVSFDTMPPFDGMAEADQYYQLYYLSVGLADVIGPAAAFLNPTPVVGGAYELKFNLTSVPADPETITVRSVSRGRLSSLTGAKEVTV